MNVLGSLQRNLSELLPKVNEALKGRGLNRMYVKPEQVTPVLNLLRGQDSFEHKFAKAQAVPGQSAGRTSRARGPVDLGFDFQRPALKAVSFGDGFEPPRRVPVQMRPADGLRPLTAQEATSRFLAQLGASVVG